VAVGATGEAGWVAEVQRVQAGERGPAAEMDRAGRAPGDAEGGAAPAGDATAVHAMVVTRGGSGRRRRRQVVARPHAVFARFSAEEFEILGVAAAAAAGLTPTSFVAARAVAVARGVVRPVPSGTASGAGAGRRAHAAGALRGAVESGGRQAERDRSGR